MAHIDEIEFLAELLRTVIWTHNNPDLIMCGIADNAGSNIYGYPKGQHGEAIG